MPFIPHTEHEVRVMLDAIGVDSLDELFAEVPDELRAKSDYHLPPSQNELAIMAHAAELAALNQPKTCFIGAGSYDHHIPAAVWDIASRGEFMTSYTPYQAEASQGSLQLLYEFQTMICELTGMDVANASMYDGATALSEAVLMAVRIQKKHTTRRVLVAGTLHPFYLATLRTVATNQDIDLITVPFAKASGTIDPASLAQYADQEITAMVIASPNFFGNLEAVDELTNWCKANNALAIACVNPIALALYQPPGTWGDSGVDIVCGEGQPLGAPLASGGPYFGFFSTRMEFVRQLPGRIVGKTTDAQGNEGYTLTLQAREQHIRRGKATSNICTNQGLLVTVATIHMSLLGASGLLSVAQTCHAHTHYLATELAQIAGVELAFVAPYFHEVVIRLHKPVAEMQKHLADNGILAGFALADYFPEYSDCIVVCATEKRTKAQMQAYIQVLRDFMGS